MIIFPCNADKSPRTKNGFKDAAPYVVWEGTADQDAPLWGAPTGKANGFVVVDFDVKGGGLDTFKQFEWGGITVDTPSGGKHVYYRTPDFDVGNRVRFLPGTDFRGEGGYICLYEDVDFSQLTDMPPFLTSILKAPPKKLAEAGEVVEGGRNDFLSRYAGRMQRVGVLTYAALQEVNEEKCSPPLPESEVQLIVDSIKRYAPESLPEDDETPAKPIEWLSDHISAFIDYIRNRDAISGKPTGLDQLDDLLGGGKRLGELTVTAAEAKSGKNTFWHFLMLNWLNEGTPIGYASRELDPAREVLPNLLTLALSQNVLRTEPDLEDIEAVTANWKLAFAPGIGAFDQYGDGLFTWMDACRQHDIKYFFIDHLHLLIYQSDEHKIIADLCRRLKKYAMEHKVHIDLIIQPKLRARSKDKEGKWVKEPFSKDTLRGGANLGQILDTLIVLERQADDEGTLTNVVNVRLDTARSKLAKLGDFYLSYNPGDMTFSRAGKPGADLNPALAIPSTRITPRPSDESILRAASNMAKRLTSPRINANKNMGEQ